MRASRRAISVLPTPVEPIMMMFFGITSAAMSGGSFLRRTRLRSAIATARFAHSAADDVLIKLGDDLTRRHLVEPDFFVSFACQINNHFDHTNNDQLALSVDGQRFSSKSCVYQVLRQQYSELE